MHEYPVTVEGFGSFYVKEGTKLAKSIEDNGIDISHRCGGNARCTTCNVLFYSEEPPLKEIEENCLVEDQVLGQFRLSCQIRVDRAMHVKVLTRASDKGWDPGQPLEP